MAQRIDGLYRRIEVLAFDQNRTQPELDLARQRVAGEITNDATALSAYAAELSAIGTTLELSAVERQEFLGLAGDLQEASENLILATSEGSSQNLTDAIYTLRETCAACHSLYRGR